MKKLALGLFFGLVVLASNVFADDDNRKQTKNPQIIEGEARQTKLTYTVTDTQWRYVKMPRNVSGVVRTSLTVSNYWFNAPSLLSANFDLLMRDGSSSLSMANLHSQLENQSLVPYQVTDPAHVDCSIQFPSSVGTGNLYGIQSCEGSDAGPEIQYEFNGLLFGVDGISDTFKFRIINASFSNKVTVKVQLFY